MEETTKTVVSQHAVGESQADAGARDQQTVLRLEGAADVNAELAEIGLSDKSGWYASILLYGVGGLVTVAAGLLRPDIVPSGVLYLGIFAIIVSGLSALGARYLTNADWATHLRLICGLAIFLIGALVAGPLRLAFLMLPLFVLITPTFLYGARFAIPYVTIVTPMVVIVALATPGPGRAAHAVITGGALMMVVISFMVAEHRTRSLARANRHLAYTDALTGIANTRRLRETLASELGQEPLENGQPFALFAIDLDNFKLVNDIFDHVTGDAVLCAVADALEAEVGEDDLVARRGGDEFSVLVKRSAGVDLDRLQGRLSDAIERARLATCPQITPSGSVAYVLSEEDDSISSILQRADDMLHASKVAFHAEHGDREAMRISIDADFPTSLGPPAKSHEAALRSVSAAVSRAYSRPRKGQMAARRRSWSAQLSEWSNGLEITWTYVAATCIPVGTVSFILGATGALSPEPRIYSMPASLAIVAIGVFALHAARSHLNRRWVVWAFLAVTALITGGIAQAGATGTALIDIYVVLALFSFYMMRPRQAFVMLSICAGLFVGLSLIGDYPDAGIRSAITISVVAVAALIVVKVRSVTLRFVRTNRELSEVDALTGVANLRALKLRVESAIEQHTREPGDNRPMLMTVDLDRFKQVNDRYNHTTGDQVLEAVARAISECVRIDEMVARRGGDEFFVLFTNTNPAHIESAIPRVRKAIAHARERICPDLIPTASVGYVSWEPGMDAKAFMASADGIMHDEKIETRSREYEQVA